MRKRDTREKLYVSPQAPATTTTSTTRSSRSCIRQFGKILFAPLMTAFFDNNMKVLPTDDDCLTNDSVLCRYQILTSSVVYNFNY